MRRKNGIERGSRKKVHTFARNAVRFWQASHLDLDGAALCSMIRYRQHAKPRRESWGGLAIISAFQPLIRYVLAVSLHLVQLSGHIRLKLLFSDTNVLAVFLTSVPLNSVRIRAYAPESFVDLLWRVRMRCILRSSLRLRRIRNRV